MLDKAVLEQVWRLPETERRPKLLCVLKTELSSMYAQMQNLLKEQTNGGIEAMYDHAAALDSLLSALSFFICEIVFPADNSENPTLVAVGGYGRCELAPYSDIDILFLLNNPAEKRSLEIISFLLYLLWDCGLKVGHAVRTPEECILQAEKDITICTNLLESRFICGDSGIFDDFAGHYEKMRIKTNGQDFFDAKRAEQKERYARMGQSRYMLEPNIKESRGGLRDLHLLFWLSKYLFGVTDIQALAEQDFLNRKTIFSFLKAHRFLCTVRCHLHFLTKRDILTFDAQKEIASRMKYGDRPGTSAVERFMKHYYLISKNVGELTRLMTVFIEDNLNQFISIQDLKEYDGFCLINNRIAFKPDICFEETPLRLLEAFAVRQKTGLDLHPAALQAIAEKAKLVRRIRKTPQAQVLFSQILLSGRTESALREMSESGLLGYFIPSWQNIVAQMQFDLYHVYTTDEHTLKAIGFASGFENIQSRKALYIAVLLHDIAKGRGGNHAEKGAETALKITQDLGLDQQETETVIWLIRNHLLMSQTAFRRDIFDPKTIHDFVLAVQSPERLRLLYALTKADIMAVGPNVWNSFKEKLLGDLYTFALEKMQGSDLRRRELSESQKEFASLPPSNEISFSAKTDKARGATEFIVYAPDHDGLFAEITGAMALTDVSVAEAQILTLPNGMALDTFLIQETTLLEKDVRKPLSSEKKIKRLQETIRQAAFMDIEKELSKKDCPLSGNAMWFPPRVFIDNSASDACTLIEINGNDAVGFLHAVTHTMTLLDLNIVSAHIYTYGSHVVDVFYVTGKDGRKITDISRIEQIKTSLLDTIHGSSPFSD